MTSGFIGQPQGFAHLARLGELPTASPDLTGTLAIMRLAGRLARDTSPLV